MKHLSVREIHGKAMLFPVPRPDHCKTNKITTCFPSAAKVTSWKWKLVTMSELKTGDKVQTGNEEKGSLQSNSVLTDKQ